MEHSKDTTDAVNPLFEKKSNENSGNTTSPSPANQASTSSTNIDSGGGPVSGRDTNIGRDLIVGDVYVNVAPGVIIEPISQQELNTIEDLGFAPFTLEVRKQLTEKNVFVLYGHTRHGKRNTALHLLSMLRRTEYLEIDSYVDWKQLHNFVSEESRGYFIDMESAGNAVELTGLRLKRLNRVLEELSSYLVIAVKDDDRRSELEEYILKPEELPCPYRGLKAFRMEDKDFFFGREEFTRQLVKKVRRERVVVVLGASGSGKSSVVFAGLVPRLLCQEEQWIIVDCRLYDKPFQYLIQSLLPLYENHLSGTKFLDKVKEEKNKLQTGERSLRNIIEQIADEEKPSKGSNDTPRFLLIIDQFEELYTHCEEEIQKKFINMLIDTAESSSHVPIHLVLTLRVDFLKQAIESQIFNGVRKHADAKLGAMRNEQLKRAIIEPAQKMGVYFEDQLLVEKILADVGEKAGDLPLLEFALEQLWTNCENFKLTHAAYTKIGGVKKALSRHADQTYDEEFNLQEQERVRHIFTKHLLRIGQNDTRRIATRSNLRPGDWKLITKLATHRLVITDKKGNDDTVEMVHETLIQNWGRLRKWIEHDRGFLAWQNDLRIYMERWKNNGKDESTLFPSKLLPMAKDYLNERPSDFEKLEIEYIELSVEQHQKLEREKKQRGILLLAVLVAILTAVVIAYFWQDAEVARADAEVAREESEGLKLASNSQNLLDSNYDLALLLAIEATDKVNTLQTNTALRQALRYQGQPIARITDTVLIKQVLWNPVEPYFMTVSDRQVKVWQAERLERLRLVHEIETESTILHTAWRPDGQYFAIATQGEKDKDTTQVWKIERKERISTLPHSHDVTHLAWNKEGDRLATASRNHNVAIWDMSLLDPIRLFLLEHEGAVDYIAWNNEESQIATISNRKTYLWNVDTQKGELSVILENDGQPPTTVLWNHDDTRLLTIDNKASSNKDQNNVYIWDAQTGEKYQTLSHEREVHQAVWSRDGKHVLTAGDDGKSRIWDVERQEVVMTLVGHEEPVHRAIWNKDESQIMTSSRDGTIRIWNTTSGNEIARLTGHQDSVNQAVWNPDENRVVSVSEDKTIRVWNSRPGEELPTLRGHQSEITYVAWNKDGTRIVTASEDHTARIWDAQTGETLHILDTHQGKVNQAVWSPDEKYMVTVANEDVIRFWDATNGELLATADEHEQGHVKQANWFDQGTELLLLTASTDRTARIWSFQPPDSVTLKHILRVSGPVNQAVWNPDGTKIATVANDTDTGEIWVWDSAKGEDLLSFPEHENNVGDVDWHPDGTKLVTASEDQTARIWNITDEEVTQRAIHTLAEHTGVIRQATWSPDGIWIATASGDGTAIIWDAANGRAEHVLRGHGQSVNQANWNKDGRFLVTASNDGTARIWDATQGEQIALLEGHPRFVNLAVWDRAGRRIVTADSDGVARLYYVFIEDLREIACQRAVRNMSEAEWQQFMAGEARRDDTCRDKPSPD